MMGAVAALTSINSTMIVGARTNYALGRDWAMLRGLAALVGLHWRPRKRRPASTDF